MSTLSFRETGKNTNISKIAMLDYLKAGPSYPPVDLMVVSGLPESSCAQAGGASTARGVCDAIVELMWRDETVRYVVEIDSSSQPAVIEQAVLQAQRAAQNSGLYPMVLVPYLSEEALIRLSAEAVSGIDCCGNCVILGPSLTVWRSGAPNQFRESRPIRNPYSGDSSIITRSFLLQRRFGSLDELRKFALNRTHLKEQESSKLLQTGTISKVVQALESEIIISRGAEGIMMTDVRRLLDRLRAQYRPGNSPHLLGKTPLGDDQIWQRLSDARGAGSSRSAATGMTSAAHYGTLSGIDRLSLYVDDLESVSSLLSITEGRAFANIELIETRNNLPFFDCRVEDNVVWASPIQTWLELAQGGAREMEAAQSLEQQLLVGAMEVAT